LIVAAANPCPCGGGAACACSDDAIWQYRARLSGPLADRLDLAPSVAPLSASALLSTRGGEPSAAVARRVATARAMAAARDGVPVRRVARPAALQVLADAVERGQLTGRGFDRALRVARSCADLEGSELVEEAHAYEALAHRMQLRAAAGAATLGAVG
jgi:magnesium chelatase family protein